MLKCRQEIKCQQSGFVGSIAVNGVENEINKQNSNPNWANYVHFSLRHLSIPPLPAMSKIAG